MDTITWVGINHYVPKEKLEEFYDSLKEGDVVNFVPEPENFWDTKAIAVYYKFLMRGHISKDETDQVHLMNEYGRDLIGRITDDIDRDINEIKVMVESVNIEKNTDADYPTLNDPVLGMAMNPFVMREENSYRLVKTFVDKCVSNINLFSTEDEMVFKTLEKIKDAIGVYLTIWNRSISREANQLPRYFENVLLKLSNLSGAIKNYLKPVIADVRKIMKSQAKVERHIEVFEAQIDAMTKEYSKRGGFFDVFENIYGNNKVFLKSMITKIEQWLKGLPVYGENAFGADYGGFVHSLYYKGFKVKDYYMILTHLVLMRRIIMLLYGDMADVHIRDVVSLQVVNHGMLNVNADRASIGTLIDNNGTVNN